MYPDNGYENKQITHPLTSMTTADQQEPTLADVIEKLDKLSQEQERFSQEQERFNDRFSNYQQATQWVV